MVFVRRWHWGGPNVAQASISSVKKLGEARGAEKEKKIKKTMDKKAFE